MRIKTVSERLENEPYCQNTSTILLNKYFAMIEESKELRAAYEALQKENEELQQSIKKQASAWRTSDECKAKLHQERDREIIRLRSLDADNKGLKECNVILIEENAAQVKRIAELEKIKAAAEKLVNCKGRYHAEQNMIALQNVLAEPKNGDSKLTK